MPKGVVYILINDAMPGLIKIGVTLSGLQERISQLSSSSGVPLPFNCYFALEVDDADVIEKKLHTVFSDHRINAKREFFRVDPAKAKTALSIAPGKEVTPKQEIFESSEEKEAVIQAQSKSSVFRFSTVKIPIGSELTFTHDENVKATVADDRAILFEDEVSSLSAAAMKALKKLGYSWSSVRGPAYWMYEGESLSERRDRMEAEKLSDEYTS
jgi:plastocyanin